jgi:hypothetical protein
VIDWLYVAVNCLWILGLATVVAAFSYHNWRRRMLARPLAAQLRERSSQMSLGAGLSLVGLGIAVMPRSERWYTRLAALSFALVCAWVGARAWHRSP